MPRKGRYKNIEDYWTEHYTNKGMCSICAQSGFIDSRGAKTPAGVEVGRVNFCICPNGQAIRSQIPLDKIQEMGAKLRTDPQGRRWRYDPNAGGLGGGGWVRAS